MTFCKKRNEHTIEKEDAEINQSAEISIEQISYHSELKFVLQNNEFKLLTFIFKTYFNWGE